MDISTMDDANQLKALAYDILQNIEVQQNNLRLIQQRLKEVEEEPQQKKK